MNNSYCKDCFLFRGIDGERVQSLCDEYFTVREFSDGESIYRTDRFEHALGIILSGKAAANSAGGGYLRSFSPGDVFGAAALFGGGESYVSIITAKGRTSVAFISEKSLVSAADKNPVIYRNYIVFLSDKMRYLNRRIAAYTSGECYSRLLYYLSSLPADEKGYVSVPVSMAALARMLNIGRASLYRAFESLYANGEIIKENDGIIITNNKNKKGEVK